MQKSDNASTTPQWLLFRMPSPAIKHISEIRTSQLPKKIQIHWPAAWVNVSHSLAIYHFHSLLIIIFLSRNPGPVKELTVPKCPNKLTFPAGKVCATTAVCLVSIATSVWLKYEKKAHYWKSNLSRQLS